MKEIQTIYKSVMCRRVLIHVGVCELASVLVCTCQCLCFVCVLMLFLPCESASNSLPGVVRISGGLFNMIEAGKTPAPAAADDAALK